jgi:hypothetical protein
MHSSVARHTAATCMQLVLQTSLHMHPLCKHTENTCEMLAGVRCRRPGCVLCRDEAQKLWKEQQALSDAGLKVVCVVHEWIDREVSASKPARCHTECAEACVRASSSFCSSS